MHTPFRLSPPPQLYTTIALFRQNHSCTAFHSLKKLPPLRLLHLKSIFQPKHKNPL
ncbi:Hypothetical predicted protein, partial [Prunus dulcis]